MNGFYFNPEIDTLNIREPGCDQLEVFFSNNDCGLLSKVPRIAVPLNCFVSWSKWLAELVYDAKVREVTVVNMEWCKGELPDYEAACDCKFNSFAEFESLTEDKKLALRQVEVGTDTELLEMTMTGSWPVPEGVSCPVIWIVAMCGSSKYCVHDGIIRDEIERLRLLRSHEKTGSDQDLGEISDRGEDLEVTEDADHESIDGMVVFMAEHSSQTEPSSHDASEWETVSDENSDGVSETNGSQDSEWSEDEDGDDS